VSIPESSRIAVDSATVAREVKGFFRFLLGELKPKGKLLTPFNVISVPIILLGVGILVVRFTQGLGAVTNLSQAYPWGFWIGFDVITGVAFAGGAYIITFVVYVMRLEKYEPIVRATVLNGLLAYIFYAGALVLDLGRPWNIINPVIGNSFGYNSVLFLMAKAKIHPLWYSEFLPILFFASSIPAGLSMIILEGTISHRVFKNRSDPKRHGSFDDLVFGLAKGATISLFVYYFFKALIFIHERQWTMLRESWGWWYLLEVVGLVLVPCVMFAYAVRHRRIGIVRVASILTLLGIVLNRLNVSIIAFNWNSTARYFPSWQEIVVTLMVVFCEIWVFRWIVNRMPVMRPSEEFSYEL
jgi:Ni/Fe-hydrogenase subunit HybB-like protein